MEEFIKKLIAAVEGKGYEKVTDEPLKYKITRTIMQQPQRIIINGQIFEQEPTQIQIDTIIEHFGNGSMDDKEFAVINFTIYQLESFLNGNLDEMIDALAAADKADRLKEGDF